MKVFLASILVLAVGAMTVNGICTLCSCINNSPTLSCVHGTCVESANTGDGTCACVGGWEGPRCDIATNQQGQTSNPCAESPCQNSGHCNPAGTLYTCTCTNNIADGTSYIGINCETLANYLPCSLNPCTTSAKPRCLNMALGYRCMA